MEKGGVQENEFVTQAEILSVPITKARFLTYLPADCPPGADNWLLDLLQGHKFNGDHAILAVQEVGLQSKPLTPRLRSRA